MPCSNLYAIRSTFCAKDYVTISLHCARNLAIAYTQHVHRIDEKSLIV